MSRQDFEALSISGKLILAFDLEKTKEKPHTLTHKAYENLLSEIVNACKPKSMAMQTNEAIKEEEERIINCDCVYHFNFNNLHSGEMVMGFWVKQNPILYSHTTSC